MNTDLTEEEMRRALFGSTESATQMAAPAASIPAPDIATVQPAKPPPTKKVAKAFTPRLRVTMQVTNEFEGKTFELSHEADTLSTLMAEQEAVKMARKKYRYVEVISVKSM
jgi:phosphate-selective porin